MRLETVDEYLARGGRITPCPPAIEVEEARKRGDIERPYGYANDFAEHYRARAAVANAARRRP